MNNILRFKDLPAKNFGSCECCGQRPARVYGVSDMNKSVMANFICRDCITPGAVEFPHERDLYAA